MRDTVSASVAITELVAACRPLVEFAREKVAVLSVPGVGLDVLLQMHPLSARVLATGPASVCQVVALTGAAVPGAPELEDALEQFIGAGLSGCPPAVVDGVFEFASRPGGGLVVHVVDQHEAACLLAPRGCELSRAVPLFRVQWPIPAEEAEPVTCH